MSVAVWLIVVPAVLMLRVVTRAAVPAGVIEKSSTSRPSSAPEAFESVHRIQNVAPAGMFREEMVELIAVRLAAALPSRAPVVVVKGEVKSSVSTPVQVPLLRVVASVEYSKSILSARDAVPRRHCSPVYLCEFVSGGAGAVCDPGSNAGGVWKH